MALLSPCVHCLLNYTNSKNTTCLVNIPSISTTDRVRASGSPQATCLTHWKGLSVSIPHLKVCIQQSLGVAREFCDQAIGWIPVTAPICKKKTHRYIICLLLAVFSEVPWTGYAEGLMSV